MTMGLRRGNQTRRGGRSCRESRSALASKLGSSTAKDCKIRRVADIPYAG
jgi:hypothetical protein